MLLKLSNWDVVKLKHEGEYEKKWLGLRGVIGQDKWSLVGH